MHLVSFFFHKNLKLISFFYFYNKTNLYLEYKKVLFSCYEQFLINKEIQFKAILLLI